jgi:hypothetical protein
MEEGDTFINSDDNYHIPTAYIGLSTHTPVLVPKSITSIAKSPTPEKWTLALENGINSLNPKMYLTSHQLIYQPSKKLIITSRVIFDTRMNADGSINKIIRHV